MGPVTALERDPMSYVGRPSQFTYHMFADAFSGGSTDWAKETARVKFSYTIELRPSYHGIGFKILIKELSSRFQRVHSRSVTIDSDCERNLGRCESCC